MTPADYPDALRAENARLRALADSLAERCAAQGELLARRAERPVPRPLFEAAVRVLIGPAPLAHFGATGGQVDAVLRAMEPGEMFAQEAAERIIRRAVAGGLTGEG